MYDPTAGLAALILMSQSCGMKLATAHTTEEREQLATIQAMVIEQTNRVMTYMEECRNETMDLREALSELEDAKEEEEFDAAYDYAMSHLDSIAKDFATVYRDIDSEKGTSINIAWNGYLESGVWKIL